MKVLVTGASGFLGGHVVDACLARGDEVRVLVRKNSDRSHLESCPGITWAEGDLRDPLAVVRAVKGCEAVCHCAARATDWGTWRQFYETNYVATRNVLAACEAGGVRRLVHVSSPGVVFDFTDQMHIDESHPYPQTFGNHYAATKARAEQLVLAANDPDGLTTVALRPHAIWGPRDKIGFFPQLVRKLRNGRLRDVTGGKTVWLDMCHVHNAAHACRLAAEAEAAAGRVYFITDDETVDSWRLLDRVCDLFGLPRMDRRLHPAAARLLADITGLIWKIPWLAARYPPPLTRYALEMMTHSTTYTIAAARRDLGYAPVTDVDGGLDHLHRWIDENGGVDAFIRHI